MTEQPTLEITHPPVQFRLVKSEARRLTPELAQEFRSLAASPTERAFYPDRVKYLRGKADSGKLVTFHWARAKFGTEWLRVNGQHSATMLCELNGAFPDNLWAHVDEYEVDSVDGLVDLFRQFDDRKSSRTAADVATAFQMIYPELRDVHRPTAKLAAEGWGWYRREVVGAPVPAGDELYGIFHDPDVQRFARWLNDLLNMKTLELRRRPIIAAMWATFTTNEVGGAKFWSDVARGGVQYDDDAPASQLDAWLRQLAERAIEKVKPATYYQAAIYAWNAFRAEKQLKALKLPDPKKGFLTPTA